jgi:hypothetical protein
MDYVTDEMLIDKIREHLDAPADARITLIDPPSAVEPGGFIAKDTGRTVTGFWYVDGEQDGVPFIDLLVTADTDSA